MKGSKIGVSFRVHPERPDRLRRIIKMLKERNLYERCVELPSREVREEELLLCHDKDYIESLKTLEKKTQDELIAMSKNPDSVYYHSDTFSCASLATGCLLTVVDAVCSHKVTRLYRVKKLNMSSLNTTDCPNIVYKWSCGDSTTRSPCQLGPLLRLLFLQLSGRGRKIRSEELRAC